MRNTAASKFAIERRMRGRKWNPEFWYDARHFALNSFDSKTNRWNWSSAWEMITSNSLPCRPRRPRNSSDPRTSAPDSGSMNQFTQCSTLSLGSWSPIENLAPAKRRDSPPTNALAPSPRRMMPFSGKSRASIAKLHSASTLTPFNPSSTASRFRSVASTSRASTKVNEPLLNSSASPVSDSDTSSHHPSH